MVTATNPEPVTKPVTKPPFRGHFFLIGVVPSPELIGNYPAKHLQTPIKKGFADLNLCKPLIFGGAEGEIRTPTPVRALDPEDKFAPFPEFFRHCF